MKKGFMLGLMFFGMLGICSQASAENIFAGKVAASNTNVISAPYGGRVDNIYVHVGDYVGEDSLIATLGTDEVYALVDGTVSGIFASEGDDCGKCCRKVWSSFVYRADQSVHIGLQQ